MGRRGTRERLNWGFFQGSALLACLVGIVADSWLALGITLLIALGYNLYAGELRIGPRSRQ